MSFVTDVRKIASKNDLSQSEAEIKKKAAVIAALSSNHSWKTSKFVRCLSPEIDRESFSAEALNALNHGWKNISESDVDEVVNGPINRHQFSMWALYALEGRQRNDFLQIFDKLRNELEYNMEPAQNGYSR